MGPPGHLPVRRGDHDAIAANERARNQEPGARSQDIDARVPHGNPVSDSSIYGNPSHLQVLAVPKPLPTDGAPAAVSADRAFAPAREIASDRDKDDVDHRVVVQRHAAPYGRILE